MAEDDQQKRESKEQPIIINKKKVSGGHGHHGGAWKVAYADFVTAMMALFIVLWVLGSNDQQQLEQMAEYYNDPGMFKFETTRDGTPVAINIKLYEKIKREAEGQGKSQAQAEQEAFEQSVVKPVERTSAGLGLLSQKQVDTLTKQVVSELQKKAIEDSVQKAQEVRQVGDELKAIIKEEIRKNSEFEELLSSVVIELTEEGLRIELIDSTKNLFFQSGSAAMTSKAKKVLAMIALKIGRLPNKVVIEGHTDAVKYSSESGYSNWELSADRANSARRVLENNGLRPGQVQSVTGYADQKLRNPNNPRDKANRRISILIKQMKSKDFIERYDIEGE